MNFAERFKKVRKSTGISLDELVEKTGIGKEYLKRLDLGDPADYCNPTLLLMQTLAAGLGVKVKNLVDDDECTQTGALLAKIVSTENQRLEAVGALEAIYARIGHAVALLRQRQAPEQPPCTKP